KYILDDKEIETLKELGIKTSVIVSRVCGEIKKGDSEFNGLALLHKHLIDEGITSNVSFIGSDKRIFDYRHPITTFKKIDNYFMVVICSEFKGLIASMSRSAYFGKIPKEIEEKKNILAKIDAEIIQHTRPGKTYAEVFKFIKNTYEKFGYKDEWKHHLQGGPLGYSPRYFLANEFTDVSIEVGHAFAWNPTVRGTKSEDTFLVKEDFNECLTYDKNWPSIEIKTSGMAIKRPDILERKK
ncbi:MAG: M24 family metallopeptidase, partial [Actinobacteria bacterium]|nr:M24 family metallopeptidase [Actinomycetota bacterium]